MLASGIAVHRPAAVPPRRPRGASSSLREAG
ncbi:hypothetical protein BJ992_003607 [Sphaerisporangium rubeum]|uniref:Uncharacterized protein n=1 Tax=Sphaerisporangium rubeum TaxID=321317 RepID=A0A7X0IFB7_9ACTN|nr:hypothetical protein [Sphaerisporangium rubeum]